MMNEHEPLDIATVEGSNVVQKRGYFKELTEDIFLDELSTCIKWSNEYGDKYVSKDYFIYGILGIKDMNMLKAGKFCKS